MQQIPWTAAHEKLLTAFVGESMPDVAQIGNTWMPEFRTLGALEDLDAAGRALAVVTQASYFPGIWDTNVVDGTLCGIPWYVDTRVLFYRTDLLEAAGRRRAARARGTSGARRCAASRRRPARGAGRSCCRRTSGRSP